jgi:hypothetical protein
LGSNHFDWAQKRWPGLRAFEPQRLGTDSDWAEIFSDNITVYFRKNDGRVWSFLWPSPNPSPGTIMHLNSNDLIAQDTISLDPETSIDRERYMDRDAWRSLAWGNAPGKSSFRVGVFEDGTLRAQTLWPQTRNGRLQPSPGEEHVRLGKDANWQAVAGNGKMVLALKTDGSLWKWTFPEDPLTRPETASVSRLGTHSDWIAITAAGTGVVALARDGSLWQFQSDPPPGSQYLSLLSASRRPQKLGNIFGNAP